MGVWSGRAYGSFCSGKYPIPKGIKMTHYVKVLLENGKSFTKAYTKTSESDIAAHLWDYAKFGASNGIQVVSVTHTDGTPCSQFVGA